MSKLPMEILSVILTLVRNNSKAGEFLCCLQCCRYWNDLALPLLYKDVVLYNTTIRLFTTALTHHKLAFIRSMTLHIDLVMGPTGTGPVSSILHHEERHPRAGKLGTFKVCKLWMDIQDLVPYIRDTISLTTFSLSTTCSGEYAPPQDQDLPVRRMDIDGLLQAIPTSCRSVEVDTRGCDRYISAFSGHICEAIQKLLPQLHHLRLHARLICPAVFGEKGTKSETTDLPQSDLSRQPSDLQTVLVSTITLPHVEGGNLCYTYKRARLLKAHHDMINSARRLLTSGALPAIQKFSFIDNVEYKDRMTSGRLATFTNNDIILNVEYVHLIEPMGRGFKGHYLLRLGNDEDVYGSFRAIGDVAEGIPWLETSNGSRFPSSFALTQDAIDAGYKWNWPAVKNRADTKKRARRFGPMNRGGDRKRRAAGAVP